MSINNLIINSVESKYTFEYIANAFWNQRIAKVSKITLIPYLKNNEIYSIAYIMIDEWCDSEMAYNFIQKLKHKFNEARIVYYEEYWWSVKINTHNDGYIYIGPYTMSFQSSYFEKELEHLDKNEENEEEFEEDNISRIGFTKEWEEFIRSRPIKDINNILYTLEEAEEQLWILSNKRNSTFKEVEEIEYLKNELLIHKSLNNSNNVTLRGEESNWQTVSWNSWQM